MAFFVSCLCHAPWLGAHLKPLLFSSRRCSSDGFSSKKSCKRFYPSLISSRPKHQQADQPEEDDGGEYPGYDEFEDDGPPWDEEDETEEKEEIR